MQSNYEQRRIPGIGPAWFKKGWEKGTVSFFFCRVVSCGCCCEIVTAVQRSNDLSGPMCYLTYMPSLMSNSSLVRWTCSISVRPYLANNITSNFKIVHLSALRWNCVVVHISNWMRSRRANYCKIIVKDYKSRMASVSVFAYTRKAAKGTKSRLQLATDMILTQPCHLFA